MQTSTHQNQGPSCQTLDFIRTFARTYQPVAHAERIIVLHEERPLRGVGVC